jgi:hypothetical protein
MLYNILFMLAGGLLVAAGVCIGWRIAGNKPPLPTLTEFISVLDDDMPGPFSEREPPPR